MENFADETILISQDRALDITKAFLVEVERIVRSGGVDPEDHNRAMVFGVALENIADAYLRGDRNTPEYRNMKRV